MPPAESPGEDTNVKRVLEVPDDLRLLADEVQAGRMTGTVAARKAVLTGEYLLIGTCEPEQWHVPRVQSYFDLKVGAWVMAGIQNDLDETPRPVLRATFLPSVAAFCALFGDYNQPDQRQRMGQLRLPYPRPYFGWDVISEMHDIVAFHAVREYIEAAQNSEFHGFIDIVSRDAFRQKEEPGQLISLEVVPTLVSFKLDNRELPLVAEVDYGNGNDDFRSVFGR